MIGILLAGGAATRHPNKVLLPTRHGIPVIMSGLGYLRRHDLRDIRVVVPTNSPIVDVVEAFGFNDLNIEFVYQATPTGVGDAIMLANPSSDACMVVMGDNIYPANEQFPDLTTSAVALREVPAWRRPHLVRWNEETSRFTREGYGRYSLTTPWIFTELAANDLPPEGWPALYGFERVQLDAQGWWDIGTPDLYAAYWRSNV